MVEDRGDSETDPQIVKKMLKILRLNKKQQKRFSDLIAIVTKLNHSSIVPVMVIENGDPT